MWLVGRVAHVSACPLAHLGVAGRGARVSVRVCTCFTNVPVPKGAHVKQDTDDRSRERGVRNKGKSYVV